MPIVLDLNIPDSGPGTQRTHRSSTYRPCVTEVPRSVREGLVRVLPSRDAPSRLRAFEVAGGRSNESQTSFERESLEAGGVAA